MGNETKHTPEPWKLDPKKDWDKVIRIENKGDGHHRLYVEVCRDDCDTDTAEANARLISAAPELLAACENAKQKINELLRRTWEHTEDRGHEISNEDRRLEMASWNKIIDAAIAKAKGAK